MWDLCDRCWTAHEPAPLCPLVKVLVCILPGDVPVEEIRAAAPPDVVVERYPQGMTQVVFLRSVDPFDPVPVVDRLADHLNLPDEDEDDGVDPEPDWPPYEEQTEPDYMTSSQAAAYERDAEFECLPGQRNYW